MGLSVVLETKFLLGPVEKKGRALCLSPRFQPWPDIPMCVKGLLNTVKGLLNQFSGVISIYLLNMLCMKFV